MTDNLNAEIIAIGTEILLGEITDTNSVFIARTLRDLGINVFFMTSVGDNVERIASSIEIAMGRANLIITCGGLGPTIDDMTRQGVATATQRELVYVEELFNQIVERFKAFRTVIPENNKRQAFLPSGAIAIENPVGTAPSFIVEHNDQLIISLPGVPRELKYLMTEKVMPFIQSRYSLGIIRARILRVAGIGESALDEMIGKDLLEGSNPTIGLAAHHGIIDVRITAKADKSEQVEAMLDRYEQAVMEKIGEYVFGREKDSIEAVLVRTLQEKQKRIAVIEVGLQGIVGKLQGIPSSGEFTGLLASFDTLEAFYNEYPNVQSLGHQEFATGLASKLVQEADFSIVIISDPSINEGADVDQATVVAIAGNGQAHARSYGFGAKSELAQGWISRWAMANIWRIAKGL